ncbi:hypothetical protein AB4Z18_04995 [Leifsonia sp. 2TAF2]|uniref:hypothetical protein n=1 Tax=Leifsonia sp. 2TAF2 TaxID=3233009 RepID=UPI003F95BB6D
MRFFFVVPVGLVIAALVLAAQGAFWIAVTVLLVAAPCVAIASLQGVITRWWERRSFAKTLRQQQAGTYVEEWRRHV